MAPPHSSDKSILLRGSKNQVPDSATVHGDICITVQYSTEQYSTVQYSIVQYSTVQYSTVQYTTVQYSTAVSGHLTSRCLLFKKRIILGWIEIQVSVEIYTKATSIRSHIEYPSLLTFDCFQILSKIWYLIYESEFNYKLEIDRTIVGKTKKINEKRDGSWTRIRIRKMKLSYTLTAFETSSKFEIASIGWFCFFWCDFTHLSTMCAKLTVLYLFIRIWR